MMWVLAFLMAGCGNPADDYRAEGSIAVASISVGGFARNGSELHELEGPKTKP